MSKSSIIVGISGASGAFYGVTALKMLRAAGISTHAVVSRSGELTLRSECGMGLKDVEPLCDVLHPIGNVGASIASGSFPSLGMLVAPCSIRSLSEIVHGVTSTLLTRAADVALKERRRLVLLVRETPLHLGLLRSMTAAAEMGATILPPGAGVRHQPHQHRRHRQPLGRSRARPVRANGRHSALVGDAECRERIIWLSGFVGNARIDGVAATRCEKVA